MKNCENCKLEHDGKYGSGRFCTSKCARGFSSKEKRLEINKKVSLKLSFEPYKIICKECNNEFIHKRKKQIFCNNLCSANYRSKDLNYLKKISLKSKKRCNTLEERIRLKSIGRLGGYGKKGYTLNGTYYQSNFEKQCFEYLELNNIIFEAHKNLPNDARETDIYLVNKDIWIELDGINREKKRKYIGKNYNKWIDKINQYKALNLELKIIYTFEEFINYIGK